MKLSIIIPVYRVEDTLNRCVESVLNQNLDDFEVILVDDGSPDKCPQMCDDWAEKNANIRVVHKPNGGLSDARNAGVEKAQGDYITFVDSDDYIAADTYQPLLATLALETDVDIIEFPIYEHFGSKKQNLLKFAAEKEYTDMDDYWYSAQAYKHTYACNKIYRRELFDDVRFPVGIAFEDANTLPLLLKKARKVMTANIGLYYYCYNPSGITATADGEALSKLLQAHLAVINSSTRRNAYFQQYFMHVLNIQMDVFELTGRPILLENRKVNISVLKGKQKIKGFALNLLGIRCLCTTNKIFHYIWRNH
jgi:glycosyltransferase involved in cell wall biosynthesis